MDETVRHTAAPEPVGDGPYDAYYFAHCCGRPYVRDEHWLGFFGAIADRVAAQIQPRRALDAGCALGLLVEALRARGVQAEGIDLSSYAIAHVHESVRPFCRRGSLVDEFPDRYDLIVSIEVLEHMPARDGEAAIANICRHTDDVLFSSSPSDHREPTHLNVQPPEHWAEQFARHGFHRDVDFDASFLTPWAVRFRRSQEALPRIVRNYERQFAALAAARNDARSFSADVQRELARTEQRVATLDAERNGLAAELDAKRREWQSALEAQRAGTEQARAALVDATRQIVDLAAALDAQRNGLAAALDAQRNGLAAALDAQRNGLAAEFDAKRREWQSALEGQRAGTEQARTALFESTRQIVDLIKALDAERTATADARVELERERDALKTLQTRELPFVRAALEETHATLTGKVLAVDALEARLADSLAASDRLGHELRHARETIARMESSVFWRARGFWARLSRALGRPT